MNPGRSYTCPLFSAQVLNGTPSVSEQLLNGGQLSGRLVWGVERGGREGRVSVGCGGVDCVSVQYVHAVCDTEK